MLVTISRHGYYSSRRSDTHISNTDFKIGRSSVRVGLKPDCILDRVEGDKLDDEDFSTDTVTTSSAEVSEDKSEKNMVVPIVMEVSSESNHKGIVGDPELRNQNRRTDRCREVIMLQGQCAIQS